MVTGFAILLIAGMVLLAPEGEAFNRYTAANNAIDTNCAQCHGDYRAGPYISLSDGQDWGDNLMDIHATLMLNGDCDTCHASGRNPVFTNFSKGGTGLDAIACIGCHGRPADRGTNADCVDPPNQVGPCGDGAGLRQHHWNANRIISTANGDVSTRICATCHADADPANYTPAGEQSLPSYYFIPDAAHPTKPTDPCNPPPSLPEDFKGLTIGLNNDGDHYTVGARLDEWDPDCGAPNVALALDSTDLMWPPFPSAAAYDIVQGDLETLHTSGGDFKLATKSCFVDNWGATSIIHAPDPVPGQGFFYILRVVMPSFVGNYDSGGAAQFSQRDQDIADSGFDCP
jgi:hypothetical protein